MVKGGGWLGLRPGQFYGTATDIVGLGIDYPALTKRFGEIGVPVGILFGTADNVLDHQANGIDMVGRIPGLELELADGIGHMPQFVAPERTAAFIRKIAERAFALRAYPGRS
jgi:pimeloyl-ACP methyl ester carboxylesterase